MMQSKKFLIAVFLVLFLLVSSNAYSIQRFSINQELETYMQANSTGAEVHTLIAVTTIIPAYHRILGYRIAPYDVTKGSQFTLAFCDSATVAAALDATIFDEAEKSLTTSMDAEWYPYPKRLTNGLVVRQGGNSVITIYYEDTRKF